MVIDYLKHILFPSSSPANISLVESRLLGLIEQPFKVVNDQLILDRLSCLITSKESINVHDLGAGSKTIRGNERKVRQIAKYASIQPKYGQLYASIIAELKFSLALELGTSFGIGTAYLASKCEQVITMEGCPKTAEVAKETFKTLKLGNINLQIGEFTELLSALQIVQNGPVFVYLDGNHQYAPTIEYFEFCKEVLPENSILIFDDIYWSSEMKKAWQYIQEQPYFTIDLYKVGILLLTRKTKSVSLRKRF